MTFLGLEQPVEYGRQQVFDPTTAQMVLNANRDYINAVYNDYRQALADMKEFNEKYGDFMSPIAKDMDWYEKNVTGDIRNFINNLYDQGIDPLRSAEGRALITRKLANMPTGEIALLRQSAETAKEYLKSFDDDTNPELEKFLGRDLSNWSTLGDKDAGIKANGIWGYNKASKYQTIDDLIEPIVKNVDYTYDDAMTKQRNDGNNYYSITRDRLMQAVNDNMADILATPSGAFHWEQAKKAAAAQGGGEDLAKSIFNTMIGNRLSDHERVKFEADQFKLDDRRTANDIRANREKAAIDFEYDKRRLTDPEFVAASAINGSGSGNKKNKFNPNIFREAEANANAVQTRLGGSFGYGVQAGEHVGYVPSGQYEELIDPIVPGKYIELKDKNSGQVIQAWNFNNQHIANNIYVIDENNKVSKVNISNNYGNTSYRFIPDGQIKAARAGNGYRYYVSGTLKGNKNNSPIYDPKDHSTQLWIEVKERGYAYDGK